MKKRILSAILIICLAVSLTVPVLAASYTPFGGNTTATIDGITYSDVFGAAGRDISEPSAFFTTALNSGSPNLREYWTNLSRLVLLSDENIYNLIMQYGGGVSFNSSGSHLNRLTIAKSLSAAESAIRGSYSMGDNYKLASLADNTAEQTVLYYTEEFYRSAVPLVEDKFVVATIFYDFKLSYLNTDGELASAVSGCDTVEAAKANNLGTNNFIYNDSGSGQSFVSGIQNQSASEIVATQSITNSQSMAVGSSVTSTKEYGFSEMIGSETKFTAKIPFVGSIEETIKLEFTASQTFSSSQGSSTENTQSQSVENSLQVALPPHTEVVLQQDVSDINMQINYDYPVAISYKVKTIELYTANMGGTPTGIGIVSELATFGRANQNHSSAVENLYNRYINRYTQGYEASYGDSLNWDTLHARYNTVFGGSFGNSINLDTTTGYLYRNRPMSVTGGVLSVGSKGISSKVYGISPLYPLSTIKPDGAYDYDMTTGDRFYVDNIAIAGSNASNVPYYGFSSDYGQWILVDESGHELHDSDIAWLQTNPVTGNTYLVAGNTAGTVYLKYLINENVYSYRNNIGSYTKNSDLAQTAVIQVNVSHAPFDGEINVSGSITGYVGDPAINLDDCGLDVLVTDTTGKELARSIVWEAQELPVRGILVMDNKVSFTKAGIFHIRAVTGDIKSKWIEVTALPARVLGSLEIADNNSPSILNVDIKNNPAVIDLEGPTNFITVNTLDQYGAAWPDTSTLEWKCDDANVAITGSSLTVDTKGSYEIYAEIGGMKSNTLILTVYDSGTTHDAYISGYGDGTFGPDDHMTRAQAAQMFYNLMGDTSVPGSGSFTDVSADAWYYEAVTALAGAGIISGYPDGSFGPENVITRAEFAVMAVRFAGLDATISGETDFPDISNTHWASKYIAAAQDAGYVEGYPNGNFEPEDEMTRAQAVTLLNRINGRDAATADFTGLTMPFNDVPKNHWAYSEIMEAAVEHPGH